MILANKHTNLSSLIALTPINDRPLIKQMKSGLSVETNVRPNKK